MRILGGKDYYDNMIQYGIDPLIILKRNDNKLYNDSIIQELEKNYTNHFNYWCPYQIIHNKTQDIVRVRNSLGVNGIVYYFNRFTVIIGNNIYGGTVIRYNNKTDYYYSENSLESFLNTLGFSLTKSHVIKKYPDSEGHENISLDNRLIKYMIEKKISIITFSDYDPIFTRPSKVRINGDNLREFQLYKRLNGYEVHQKLSHWVGNVLLTANQMRDTPSNDMKIAKHGFDKFSFRKQKA